MKKISRRKFITSFLSLGGLALAGVLLLKLYQYHRAGYSTATIMAKIRAWLRYDKPLTDDEQESLRFYLELLIPEDETPGATAAGIDRRLFERCTKQPYYRKTLREGLIRLSTMAAERFQQPFHRLSPAQAEQLITASEQAGADSLERILFIQLREDAFIDYYAQSTHWSSLCYQGPPQPMGYLNSRLPPEQCGMNG